MPRFVHLHFEKQEKLTDYCFLKSNSQPPSPAPILFVLLCTSRLGAESCGPCKAGVCRGCTEREGVSPPLGCLVVGVKLWFPFSLLWQSLRPPWKIRQAHLEPGLMVQTQENSPLCLSALRTHWGLSALPWASGLLAPVLRSPASISLGGLVRMTQCPLRALVLAGEMLCVCVGGGHGGIWVCAKCQPTPPQHRCCSLQTRSPAGQAVQQLPLLPQEGSISPQVLGLRPLGAGLCPPRCCLEAGPLSAMKRVQAQAALKTDVLSDG